MFKTLNIKKTVLFYELFGDETFTDSVFNATKGYSLIRRLIIIGVAEWHRKHVAAVPEGIWTIEIECRPWLPLSRAKYKIYPGF